MIKVVARNYLKDGAKDEALNLMDELIGETRKESGCVSYELYQSTSDPDEVTFIETWESAEALDAHMKTEHFTRIVPQLDRYKAKDGEITVYKLIK
ncbi:MAG: antibiotic biosynthesis monooxygenase [Clostridiales Family XIII bacterium]|jgi:quinol monooxygenase YgiN|nr:antibiotic biosynthesis monooxygenase [Clostridiales Family XIII bacterium]